mmetsp:Transcript_4871/g.8505  ORF Transcript_4871/g.8505 Transcript_4871/m.8505 type:complete len:89 (+) Transcript_4871:1031-1297(+)
MSGSLDGWILRNLPCNTWELRGVECPLAMSSPPPPYPVSDATFQMSILLSYGLAGTRPLASCLKLRTDAHAFLVNKSLAEHPQLLYDP